MAIGKVNWNSKKIFFGGRGSLIPFSGNMTPPSQRNSENQPSSTEEPNVSITKEEFNDE